MGCLKRSEGRPGGASWATFSRSRRSFRWVPSSQLALCTSPFPLLTVSLALRPSLVRQAGNRDARGAPVHVDFLAQFKGTRISSSPHGGARKSSKSKQGHWETRDGGYSDSTTLAAAERRSRDLTVSHSRFSLTSLMFSCRNPNVYNVGGHGDDGPPGVQGILQGRDQAEDDGHEEEAAEEVVQEAAQRMRV